MTRTKWLVFALALVATIPIGVNPALADTANGTVGFDAGAFTWGTGSFGLFGDGTFGVRPEPILAGTDNRGYLQVSSTNDHVLGLDLAGTVWPGAPTSSARSSTPSSCRTSTPPSRSRSPGLPRSSRSRPAARSASRSPPTAACTSGARP
jgi:hypothetical protein